MLSFLRPHSHGHAGLEDNVVVGCVLVELEQVRRRKLKHVHKEARSLSARAHAARGAEEAHLRRVATARKCLAEHLEE